MTFEEIGVAPEILKAITELGFEKPMPIQEKIIPVLLNQNTDITGLAQTGTGKTAAFGIPIVQQTDVKVLKPQVLILSPTRELCVQITNDLINYSKYIDGLKILAVYGGSSIENQIKALKSGVHVIVATPGRLIDLMERKAAKLSSVYRVVLDEADEMLNMGFLDEINRILADVPPDRNTLLFSATMPAEIQNIAKKYMRTPVEIVIGTRNAGAENVRHYSYTVHAKDKYLALKRLADYYPNIYGIVFCRTRKETQEIADKLIHDGYNADSLHGDLSQIQRDSVMQKFRIRNIQLLVATDVAARGLDVSDLTHVIHYSLPDDHEVYTHRSGRTGRVGKAGISIAITHLKEKHVIRRIEKSINKEFILAKIPSSREICEKQLFHLIDKMEKVELDHSEIDTYLPVIYKKLEWLDKNEIIKRFVSLEFNRFLDYYRDAGELEEPEEVYSRKIKTDRPKDFDGKVEEGFTRIFINLGKMDGMVPNALIDMINKHTPGEKVPVGRIDLMKKFSFFEVKSRYAGQLIKALNNNAWFRGDKVMVEIAQGKQAEPVKKKKSKSGKKDEDFTPVKRKSKEKKFSKKR